MLKKKLCTLFICLSSLWSLQTHAQTTTVFADDFETPQTWTIFEEIVSGNACYGDNIGEVTPSTDNAKDGSTSLRVWSNKKGSTKSNHVIAAHPISNTDGITGQLSYGMWVYMTTTIGLTQSGPEFSVQSTRTVGAQNLTYIAGIQYIGNQWVGDKWNIWHNGTWQTIKASEFGTTLAANTWYYLELDFDMTSNTYTAFKIQGGGLTMNVDLTQPFQNAPLGFKIGGEARHWSPSLFVTAESENLWTTCSEVRENKVYYDNILLQSATVLPLELLDFQGFAENRGNRLAWTFADAKDLDRVVVEKSKDGLAFEALNVSDTSKVSDTFRTFTAMDDQPFDLTYYRLKRTERNGHFSLSKTIAIKRLHTEGGHIHVYPNPAHDFLTIDNAEGKDIVVVNTLGQVVLSENNIHHSSLIIHHLQNGVYFVKIGSDVLRFVKN